MSLITPDSFVRLPANTTNTNGSPITIFFITGNPGLIGYYHTFLSLLSDRLGLDSGSLFQVYGHSLVGFELGSDAEKNQKEGKGEGYYNLEGQISYVQKKLDTFVTNNHKQNQKNHDGEVPKVILIGHSVGTYIAMEVLRRHHERQRQHTTTPADGKGAEFNIIGGVMLFPTVVDIAKSPAGQRLSVRLPLPLPFKYLFSHISYSGRWLTQLIEAIGFDPRPRYYSEYIC